MGLYLQLSVKTSSCNTENQPISFLETILIVLKRKKIGVEGDIEKIETFIRINRDDMLKAKLERVAKSLLIIDGKRVMDDIWIGLVDLLSINFELFQNEEFLYDSILRQVLRICGLVMSCIWQISDIDANICSGFADEQEKNRITLAKNISQLQRFASYLHEIECTENMYENDILEMKKIGAFCEELKCLPALRERTNQNPRLIGTYVKLSILQQTILWQMYAAAKQPDHSDKTARHLHRIILLQKDKDVRFLQDFPEKIETILVTKYSNCLGCQLQMSKLNEVVKLTTRQKLHRMQQTTAYLQESLLKRNVKSGGLFFKK